MMMNVEIYIILLQNVLFTKMHRQLTKNPFDIEVWAALLFTTPHLLIAPQVRKGHTVTHTQSHAHADDNDDDNDDDDDDDDDDYYIIDDDDGDGDDTI